MRRSRSVLATVGLAAATALTLTACAGGGDAPAETGGDGSAGGESFSIGISQLAQHPALDAAAEGFQAAFDEAGIDADFDLQNANGEQATATTIAQTFQTSGKDLILAIATPAAQAAAQAIADAPVLFTAVTDPQEAGLVESNDAPGGNVTGTTDLNPVADQLALLKEIMPDAQSVGIIYSSGEVNSQVQVDLAKEAADELGITISEATVTNASEVATAAQTLGDVDAIYVPTDNRVTEAFETVVQYAEDNQVPLFGSEVDQVARGAIATLGLDYYELGYQTGEMAIRILTEDADPASMPVETLSEFLLNVNPGAAERMGITVPEDVLGRADETIE
ncbi:hypothetical protein GCM10011490_07230 [Pseudoclavibacter endophyticus]|uniref:ABC transporter substrate-binding protein n=1 Tax=Pseudoclavibacter endophyticus TaxID=1778590 RepID=A0A6H9WTP8_9MICO|nr:ABC transporter substrate-binding protein [Pseudoclavibacter endophyticus]KAB1649794.1 ABC transporter substrate-binding protein [Pseudoclavibacter endophyticus]GGA59694.1 hypothetical protein GCM10011490_07230 [Pseudoclavibacter endophyticus]